MSLSYLPIYDMRIFLPRVTLFIPIIEVFYADNDENKYRLKLKAFTIEVCM